jgi:mannose-6-phosphate isomerase-like protein (cupin superfamily)
MGIRLTRRVKGTTLGLALVAGLCAFGCQSPDPTILGYYPGELTVQNWRTIAAANRPGRGEILRVVDAGHSNALSNHIVIIQSRELPHRHKTHDATVVLLRGTGTMVVGKERKKIHAGAVMFIPRGTVHYFTNEGKEPAVALAIYAPPFDGKDREIVRTEEEKPAPKSKPSAPPPATRPAAAAPSGTQPGQPAATAPAVPAPGQPPRPQPSPGAVINDQRPPAPPSP